MKFNINQTVRVKLTERGRLLHRQRKEERYRSLGLSWDYKPPREDAEGWSEWQLWDLMREFGPLIDTGMGVPFETTVRLDLAS